MIFETIKSFGWSFHSKPIDKYYNKVEGSQLEEAIFKKAMGSYLTVASIFSNVRSFSILDGKHYSENKNCSKNRVEVEVYLARKAITEYLARPKSYVKH